MFMYCLFMVLCTLLHAAQETLETHDIYDFDTTAHPLGSYLEPSTI